jgi:hypothetical protein
MPRRHSSDAPADAHEVVVEISTRLLSRIQLDFPNHTKIVLDRLGALDGLVAQSGEDPERMLAAVVRLAAGRLDRLDQAIAMARLDWRDLLVAADLADQQWPARLSAWLDPPGRSPATRAPGREVCWSTPTGISGGSGTDASTCASSSG